MRQSSDAMPHGDPSSRRPEAPDVRVSVMAAGETALPYVRSEAVRMQTAIQVRHERQATGVAD